MKTDGGNKIMSLGMVGTNYGAGVNYNTLLLKQKPKVIRHLKWGVLQERQLVMVMGKTLE